MMGISHPATLGCARSGLNRLAWMTGRRAVATFVSKPRGQARSFHHEALLSLFLRILGLMSALYPPAGPGSLPGLFLGVMVE
jgi:hypothetical protein